MSMNSQGRPSSIPAAGPDQVTGTYTGNRGLQIEEPLIFEQDSAGRSGVDLPDAPAVKSRLGAVKPRARIGLPGLSEPQVVRHYTRLSQKNYAIDSGFYPLGSCTMKHNPRLNEKMARLPGFADVHPLQPVSTVQGALELMDELARWLKTLTGMAAVTLAPAAGAHGEMCGIMAIRAAHEAKGDKARTKILVPESAHGTNPATAAACGYSVEAIPATADGRVDLEALKAKLGPDVAGLMLTNPNTCGLFERDIITIAEAVHAAGAYFYCDGANFNAIVGRVRPADLGIDVMHINLHKTFSTPHGGGGPGSGPVVFADSLAPYIPVPYVVHGTDGLALVEHAGEGPAFGRMKAFHGQMGMFVRALSYMLSHGADGLWQASGDAVLNANYVMARLQDVMTASFDGPCMHECLFDDRFLKGTGVSTLDFAKAMIDEGFHPMTMYFPLVVHGALLIEPTETESKASLDQFIDTMRSLAERARSGDAEYFQGAPRLTPRRRLDETAAARKPVLRWTPPAPTEALAAE
ncbi:aminomethyl-transferring glycine dehydrogenase subunit GcvPB [Azospirillum thermophilum]|uniref:glycine dehydrogenase (aminomethyl-transferring) n=1 Tax=Azospirillum thermophilum TaxID=2202148 RepID=A0A2S2CLW0_9PROT|nr:aminomethyl-transferring glycine dehydrogenase subunit GcvPB [Azospirillum thermophilum]AWK85446.1 aminomethyl-transferring glycine dehydrogenase subunit GcvPB [Azospirillum thermophilum]